MRLPLRQSAGATRRARAMKPSHIEFLECRRLFAVQVGLQATSELLAYAARSSSGQTTIASSDTSPPLSTSPFVDYGPAVPIAVSRGAVGAVDGAGRDVFLMWLWDHRGCYSIIEIDVLTGATTQVPIPGFTSSTPADGPYYSILYNNKFYAQFNYQFLEFDPVSRSFSYFHSTTDQRAMSMTVDDSGNIWAADNPNCGLVKFNTTTKVMTDFGSRYTQNFQQYPYSIACDDQGWVYIGDGTASSQVLAVNPTTGATTALLTAGERQSGNAFVYRNTNGKVYGQALQSTSTWFQLYGGVRTNITSHTINFKPYIAGNQSYFNGSNYASGRQVVSCDVVSRKLTYTNAGSSTRFTSNFSYATEGAYVMSIVATPDGRIAGGGTFPMYQYELSPSTGVYKYTNIAGGQWNTVYRRGTHVYAGSYPEGVLLDWDTTKPWTLTSVGTSTTNPKALVADSLPDVNRPGTVYATPDGRYVLMGGTPDYGLTGGGLVIYDLTTNTYNILNHNQIVPNESPFCVVSLGGNLILGGTTVAPGTGGVQVSNNAHLFIMDLSTRTVIWTGTPFTNALTYINLYMGANGMVYGILDNDTFFTFNPATRTVIKTQSLVAMGNSASSQGPHIFCDTPNGTYVLLNQHIAKLNFTTNLLEIAVDLPTSANCGLDYFDGKLFFVGSGQSHVWSWSMVVPDIVPPTMPSYAFAFEGVLLPAAPHRVTLNFSEDVSASLSAADITVLNTTTGATIPLVNGDLAWNSTTNSVTITFSQLPGYQLPTGSYTATVNAAGVTDAAGNPLSGNNVASFSFLAGDIYRNGVVNFGDLLILTQNYGQTGQSYATGDLNYDGEVNFSDLLIMIQNYGRSLIVSGTGSTVAAAGLVAPGKSRRGAQAQLENAAQPIVV